MEERNVQHKEERTIQNAQSRSKYVSENSLECTSKNHPESERKQQEIQNETSDRTAILTTNASEGVQRSRLQIVSEH